MRQHNAAFGNYVCRFGDEKELIDYLEEIVLPSFLDDTLIRSYGKTQFFFYEAKSVLLEQDGEEPVIAITGQFIKNTQLTREQIFDADHGVIRDEAAIASAPSSYFMLLLNNHRLVYFPETAHAPDLRAFRSTSLNFLKRKHKVFIDSLYDELKNKGEKVTKKKLYETHPEPTLELIPVSGDEALEAFIYRYAVLQKIEFRLVTPNSEIDGEELFSDIREYFDGLDSETTKIEARNNDGLNIDGSLDAVKSATATTNQEVRLSGKDKFGNTLKGDNHEFKISTPIDPIPATRTALDRKLYGTFKELREGGAIQIGSRVRDIHEKLKKIASLLG